GVGVARGGGAAAGGGGRARAAGVAGAVAGGARAVVVAGGVGHVAGGGAVRAGGRREGAALRAIATGGEGHHQRCGEEVLQHGRSLRLRPGTARKGSGPYNIDFRTVYGAPVTSPPQSAPTHAARYS